jgi:hypothetical protein
LPFSFQRGSSQKHHLILKTKNIKKDKLYKINIQKGIYYCYKETILMRQTLKGNKRVPEKGESLEKEEED